MANITDGQSAPQGRERENFMVELQHFHESRGTPFSRMPKINGQEIDLYLLYFLVTSRGGWIKVNSRNEWNDLLPEFKVPGRCINSGVALKQIYIRFLDRYEKVHFLGEEAERGSDDDEESRHRRWSARALHTVPLTYNYHQHNIGESVRELNGLSSNLYHSTDYDKLILSLTSPLPNEQDFAINVCTLLSNDNKHGLRIDKCPRLLDMLLAHAGVFNHSSLRILLSEVYNNIRGHSLHRFWSDTLRGPKEFIDLADENLFQKNLNKIRTPVPVTSENNNIVLSKQKLDYDSNDSDDSDVDLFASEVQEPDSSSDKHGASYHMVLHKSDSELFCLGRTLGMQDYIGQRVLQVASILKNLCFMEENVPILAENKTFLRFLLLCANCSWGNLHNMALDMLGNIATDIKVKDTRCDIISDCLLNTVTSGLCCPDRAVILSCLEILNKLSQREENEEIMLRCLQQKIYEQVCRFLSLHDIMLLIYTLECLYSLTSLGERACNSIVRVHGVIDTLVSLVTVEAQTYGPKACILMRVVETVSGAVPTSVSSSTSSVASDSPSAISSSDATPNKVTNTPQTLSPAPTPPPPSAPLSPICSSTNTSNVVQTTVVNTSAPSVSSSFVSTTNVVNTVTTITMAPTVQQQHAHQQTVQENEQFALAWLRATFEPAHCRVEQQELYKNYITSCQKIGRKGVISPLHFPRCVRSVFGGTVGPNPSKENKETFYYDGIKMRNTPLLISVKSSIPQVQAAKGINVVPVETNSPKPVTNNVQAVVPPENVSPILVAQLSAPPKSPNLKKGKSPQVTSHPHLSQALLNATNDGTNSQTNLFQATLINNAQHGKILNSNIQTQHPQNDSNTQIQSSSSLIKSLLASKVNDGMATATPGMQHQVAQRQQQQKQRLLAEQMQTPSANQTTLAQTTLPHVSQNHKKAKTKGVKTVNGATTHFSIKQQLAMEVDPETLISSTTIVPLDGLRCSGGSWEPPPPLAPLSTGQTGVFLLKMQKMDEDSNSTGNNSLASSTGLGSRDFISHTHDNSTFNEDNDNSLTSFEGILLNGIPGNLNIDSTCNEDSNSKDSTTNYSHKITANKMLADLLEKKSTRPLVVNGVKVDDKFDNHNEIYSLKDGSEVSTTEGMLQKNCSDSVLDPLCNPTLKRPAEDELSVPDAKRPNLTNNLLLNNKVCDSSRLSHTPDSVDSTNGDGNDNVSSTAANLYAALAASALEDEDDLLPEIEKIENESTLLNNDRGNIISEESNPVVTMQMLLPSSVLLPPAIMTLSTGQTQPTSSLKTPITQQGVPMLLSGNQPRIQNQAQQYLVSGSSGQVQIVTGSQQQQVQIVGPQGSQMPQMQLVSSSQTGQVQLVTGSAQGNQYVLSGSLPSGQTYVMQPQTSLVQGQTQTVLVAQTPQQQGTNAKTIIILQPQGTGGNQKVVMTPQGQQVVVTQVARPMQGIQSVQPVSVMVTLGVNTSVKTTCTQSPSGQVSLSHANNIITTPIQSANQQYINNQHISLLPAQPEQSAESKINLCSGGGDHLKQTPKTDNSVNTMKLEPVNINLDNAIKDNSASVKYETKLIPQNSCDNLIIDNVSVSNNNLNSKVFKNEQEEDVDASWPWICGWRGCVKRKYKSANEVYIHVCETHCPTGTQEVTCQWGSNCDNMLRRRFSLMTHLYDRHCSTDILKLMAVRRKQQNVTPVKVEPQQSPTPVPTPSASHPGYAPNAALHAIKRHALEFVNPKELLQHGTSGTPPPRQIIKATEMDDNEGPVTKSIRLTASLILRNIVIYSGAGRRFLRCYEPHLASVALSNVESSRTIAQVLYDMNDTTGLR